MFAEGLRPITRIPLLPEALLRAHRVQERHDNRFQAAARLLQALWREDRELPIGHHVSRSGRRRRLGSRISYEAALAGRNFLTPEIAHLAAQELAYREPGALIDEERLWSNLLSSMPLAFNLFGPLKLDRELASIFVQHLWPWVMAQVDEILFEHAPARGDPAYTGDYSAFDVLFRGRSEDGRSTFIAIEVKYAEDMQSPCPAFHPRLDDIADHCDLLIEPDSRELREPPLQQLFREHMLARAMLDRGDYDRGLLVVIAPELNRHLHSAAAAYRSRLRYPELAQPQFRAISLETVISAVGGAGAPDHARALYRRYCDFTLVDGELELSLSERFVRTAPPSTSPADAEQFGPAIAG